MGIGSHTKPGKGATCEWYTPPEIIQALGPFDDDPCLPGEDLGLMRPWRGRVWLNPPYDAQRIDRWLQKLADHGNGIAIIFARTETKLFFRSVWERADALLFLKGRLHFYRADGSRAKGNAGGPSVLIAYGPQNVCALRNSKIVGAFIVRPWVIVNDR